MSNTRRTPAASAVRHQLAVGDVEAERHLAAHPRGRNDLTRPLQPVLLRATSSKPFATTFSHKTQG
jgi:hypothetical protein